VSAATHAGSDAHVFAHEPDRSENGSRMHDPARLPAHLALGPVRLRVSDAARTGAWLERVLGLSALGPGRFGVAPGTPLVELREVHGARPVPRRGLLGIYHYAILLPSRADLGRFLLHLEALAEPWGASDHLVSEAFYLTDPDGITVEVYADRPRAEWKRTAGVLDIASDPIDRAALLAAAGEQDWSGAPEGTRMGHVHFFVGDLARAERHYVQGLGFEVTGRWAGGALFVAAGGYHHHVGLNIWAAGAAEAGPGDAGLDEWTVSLGTPAELQALGSRTDAAPGADALELVVVDPWGIRLRVSVAARVPSGP